MKNISKLLLFFLLVFLGIFNQASANQNSEYYKDKLSSIESGKIYLNMADDLLSKIESKLEDYSLDEKVDFYEAFSIKVGTVLKQLDLLVSRHIDDCKTTECINYYEDLSYSYGLLFNYLKESSEEEATLLSLDLDSIIKEELDLKNITPEENNVPYDFEYKILSGDEHFVGDYLKLNFSAEDSDGYIREYDYEISFDGELVFRGEGDSFEYKLENAGEYDIRLIAFDDKGVGGSFDFSIDVNEKEKENSIPYDFEYEILSGDEHFVGDYLKVNFSAEDSDGYIREYDYEISFDGELVFRGEGDSFEYKLENAGEYDIRLIAFDDKGVGGSFDFSIDVMDVEEVVTPKGLKVGLSTYDIAKMKAEDIGIGYRNYKSFGDSGFPIFNAGEGVYISNIKYKISGLNGMTCAEFNELFGLRVSGKIFDNIGDDCTFGFSGEFENLKLQEGYWYYSGKAGIFRKEYENGHPKKLEKDIIFNVEAIVDDSLVGFEDGYEDKYVNKIRSKSFVLLNRINIVKDKVEKGGINFAYVDRDKAQNILAGDSLFVEEFDVEVTGEKLSVENIEFKLSDSLSDFVEKAELYLGDDLISTTSDISDVIDFRNVELKKGVDKIKLKLYTSTTGNITMFKSESLNFKGIKGVDSGENIEEKALSFYGNSYLIVPSLLVPTISNTFNTSSRAEMSLFVNSNDSSLSDTKLEKLVLSKTGNIESNEFILRDKDGNELARGKEVYGNLEFSGFDLKIEDRLDLTIEVDNYQDDDTFRLKLLKNGVIYVTNGFGMESSLDEDLDLGGRE